MTARVPRHAGPWLAAALAAMVLGSGLAATRAMDVDPAASRAGFSLGTRWGQALEGRFPDVRGQVAVLADGRHQVWLALDTRTVEIVDHPGYTRFTRGGGFFDAAEWPQVQFTSEAYAPELLREGGLLGGRLRIRGIERRETFRIEPAACARPGRDCDVVATGRVQRANYGMTRWGFAISPDVVFVLRIRLRGDAAA